MLIVGAKGFAQELLSVLYSSNPHEKIVFFDNTSPQPPATLFDTYPVLSNLSLAEQYFQTTKDSRFVLGLANPYARYHLTQQFQTINGILTSVIAPSAFIGHFANNIAEGQNIMHQVVIESNNRIGRACLIHTAAFISHDTIIGDFCEISPRTNLLGQVRIGNFCRIGTAATILPQVSIGDNVIVGAGSVVTKDVPSNSLVMGIPAKIIRSIPHFPYPH